MFSSFSPRYLVHVCEKDHVCECRTARTALLEWYILVLLRLKKQMPLLRLWSLLRHRTLLALQPTRNTPFFYAKAIHLLSDRVGTCLSTRRHLLHVKSHCDNVIVWNSRSHVSYHRTFPVPQYSTRKTFARRPTYFLHNYINCRLEF